MLTRRGVELPKSQVTGSEAATLRRELTVSPMTYDQAFPTRFKVYDTTDDVYIVPRFWVAQSLPSVRVTDVRPAPTPVALPFVGSLKAELRQHEAARAVMDSLAATGGAVLALATGFGKVRVRVPRPRATSACGTVSRPDSRPFVLQTTTSLWIASQLGVKTVVVVGKEFLATQWEERIGAHIPTARVTRVQGRTFDTSGDIVVAMLQTLAKRKHPATAFDDFGLLIVDECQHIGAEHFTMGLVGLALPMTIGLSATPTRKDGLTRVIHWYLGPLAYAAKRTGQDNVTVKIVEFSHPRYDEPPPINRRGDLCYASFTTMLVELPERTDAIAAEAGRLARSGRRVLVLSHRRAHAQDIASTLRRDGVDAATYLGGDKEPPDAEVTCATYALVSEGYDDARLSALVLATPTSDVVQACGRIMRGGGGSDPVIVDFVDRIGICYAQLAKRKRFYKETGFTMAGQAATAARGPEDGPEDGSEDCMFDDD